MKYIKVEFKPPKKRKPRRTYKQEFILLTADNWRYYSILASAKGFNRTHARDFRDWKEGSHELMGIYEQQNMFHFLNQRYFTPTHTPETSQLLNEVT